MTTKILIDLKVEKLGVFLLTAIIVSCSTQNIQSEHIIGEWKYTEIRDSIGNLLDDDDIMDFNMTINKDSSFKLSNGYWRVEGKWKLENDILILDGQQKSPFEKERKIQKMHLKELTKNEIKTRLHLEDKKNCSMIYKRVK